MSPSRLLTLGLTVLTACSPATVDLVQPNVVAKSAFEGEWYWLDTVVDVPYGTSATFEGAQGSLERLRWSVEEDLLVGSRAYDLVAQPDGGEDPRAPLVAYRIQGHLDIRRAYDPRTGEESNVVREDTERPWYERDFMRVDWSTNLAEPKGLTLAGVDVVLADQSATDPGDAWAPSFDDSDADGVIDHIRLYRQVVAQPDTTHFPGYGDVPTCWLLGQATVDCKASEVVVGSSFRRVPEEPHYLGLPYDDRWMATFGFFSIDRLHYDRRYGVTEPDRVRWAMRHRLYEDDLARDEEGSPLCRKAGKDRVRRCEELTLEDRPEVVRKPAHERVVRPVVYHVSNGFDPALKGTLGRLEAEWNAAFVAAIHGEQRWSCLDGGGTSEACEAALDPALQAFVLCPNNPSEPGDGAACSTDHTGPFGVPDGVPDVVLPGDLRYHLLTLVDAPQQSSPFGYGPSAADPVGGTVGLADGVLEVGAGEIIAASANLYTHALDRISQGTTDLVRLLDGDLDEAAFAGGEPVRRWVDELRTRGTTGGLVGRVEGPATRGTLVDRPDLEALLDGMDGSWGAPVRAELDGLGVPRRPEDLRPWLRDVERVLERHGMRGSAVEGRRAWEALVASPFDEQLWSEETVGAWGLDPARTDVSAALASASPLDLLDPAAADEREAAWQVAGEHALDLDDGAYTNPSLLALARQYRALGLTYEEVYQTVRRELFVSVALHELGHTVGLRHNFAASADAFNYGPAYWALRQDGSVGPRHVDPETPEELLGGIREHMTSSVMDYHAQRNGDWHGLGRYDHAAVKFGYAGLVEVLTDVRTEQVLPGWSNRDAVGLVAFFDASSVYPTPILSSADEGFLRLHYTDYPRLVDLDARVDVPYRELVPRLPPEEGQPGWDSFLVLGRSVAGVAAGAPAVPYRFCSDELASGAMCARFDEGPDPYEIVSALQQAYWDSYVVDAFARQRYGFGFGDPVGPLYRRTFRPLQVWMRYYALFHTVFDASGDPEARAYFADDRGLGGWTAASADTFRFLTQVVTRPEPGQVGRLTRPDGLTVLSLEGTEPVTTLPLGTGAWYDSEWASDGGYYWFERRSRVGTYWDRMLALQVLTMTNPYDFVGFDTASDPRAYALGVSTLWREPLTRFLGALVADDVAAVAPRHLGEGVLAYPDPALGGRVDPGAELVQPGAYWLVRYSAGLFGSALLKEGFDQRFLDHARVWEAGSADAVTPAPGRALASFDDLASGVTWQALRFPDEEGREGGVGARLLDHAAHLRALCDGTRVVEGVAVVSACGALRETLADVHLQGRIAAWFDREP